MKANENETTTAANSERSNDTMPVKKNITKLKTSFEFIINPFFIRLKIIDQCYLIINKGLTNY